MAAAAEQALWAAEVVVAGQRQVATLGELSPGQGTRRGWGCAKAGGMGGGAPHTARPFPPCHWPDAAGPQVVIAVTIVMVVTSIVTGICGKKIIYYH